MKIVLINGVNHKGSTYHIARAVAEKVGGENSEIVKPGFKTKAFFFLMHFLERNGWNKADVDYWHEKGWCGNKRPWK